MTLFLTAPPFGSGTLHKLLLLFFCCKECLQTLFSNSRLHAVHFRLSVIALKFTPNTNKSSVVLSSNHSWSPNMKRTWHFGEEPATGRDPVHSVFLLCLSALPNMATCREGQTVRLSLRDARLLYIMFLACLGFFHSSLSYSKQSRAVQVLLIPRLPLNKPVAMIPSPVPRPLCPASWEEDEKEKQCSVPHFLLSLALI